MATEYKVLRITPLTRPSETRGVEQYYRITIKTKGGTVLSVDVDDKDFNETSAAPILLAAAKNADKILSL